MFFWLVLTVGMMFWALHLTGGPPSGAADQQVALFATFAVGMVIAGTVKLLFQRGTGHALAYVAMLGVAFLALLHRPELGAIYTGTTHEAVPSVALSRAAQEAELRRAWDGHYRADAVVNGVEMRLLIDTGATMVLVPYEAVERMGLDPQALDYSVPVTTANGRSTVAPIQLASIRIGDVEVRDVSAAVAHPGRIETGLLGMSFLERLDETVFRGDRLILRQRGTSAREGRFKRAPAGDGILPAR